MDFAFLAFQTSALLAILAVVFVNVFCVRNIKDQPSPTAFPKVSLLIPARNEAANIERAVVSAIAQSYPDLEVIVLDDNSEDETWSML